MTKKQASELIIAINNCQMYVPPVIFAAVVNSEGGKILMAIANEHSIENKVESK